MKIKFVLLLVCLLSTAGLMGDLLEKGLSEEKSTGSPRDSKEPWRGVSAAAVKSDKSDMKS